jgi:8-oxo-dGTP diphosphatase
MAQDKMFYVGLKAFINKQNKIIVLNDPLYGLDFPGGKIQEGENDFVEALKSEVREETGLEIKVGMPFHTWYFEFGSHSQNAGKQVFLVGYKCEYVSGEVQISEEHTNFQWIDKENYLQLKEESEYYKALEHYFE